ncbi:MAG: cellulase family glycosylhydrolase, partial [Clostridia bacterium]|nr:cellulase family glycosylhydrolase [Clostridia bacterium]
MKEKWSKEEARSWYENQNWIRGWSGYPSNCVNWLAMWQKYGHEKVFAQIEKEFDLAQKTGFNAVRVRLSLAVWTEEHDSFMQNVEEYLVLADKYGIKVMFIFGNDCSAPKELYKPPVFGEQKVDWGYHGGAKRGTFTQIHSNIGYIPEDEPETRELFYKMVDEISAKYARDERVQIWNVWNEIGNAKRGTLSLEMMKKCFEIIRSNDPVQPLTAECWSNVSKPELLTEGELAAMELSDVISFHCYLSFPETVKAIEWLKSYERPIINTEWLNRIEHNDVEQIFPLFFLERIGSYNWGLIQGYSQTYEPWGRYSKAIDDPDYAGDFDFTKLQHDLYRFNGHPYIAKEIK